MDNNLIIYVQLFLMSWMKTYDVQLAVTADQCDFYPFDGNRWIQKFIMAVSKAAFRIIEPYNYFTLFGCKPIKFLLAIVLSSCCLHT